MLGTFILLAVTTAVGAVFGHMLEQAPFMGALVGFLIGVVLRVGGEIGDIGD